MCCGEGGEPKVKVIDLLVGLHTLATLLASSLHLLLTQKANQPVIETTQCIMSSCGKGKMPEV